MTMTIKELFSKRIDRHINGVIKIGNDNENKQQELEEYVVTRELSRYFTQFFDAYSTSLDSSTKEIGVWISGFYGSGKSHFMKILSYIIDNEEINGKRPIDFFKDDKKIDDPIVLANMEKAANISSDVMLFNIESLNNDDRASKEAILSVFLRAFNRKLGYDDKNPVIADFERHIEDEGKYDLFKDKYLELTNKEWVSDRKNIKFKGKYFTKAVTDLDIMSESDAKELLKHVHDYFHISVEDFAKMVAEYCAKKGNQHRVIFLVDEIGQYIADDTSLLLNLQTISEDFSTYCNGQAWIVVTSQQNIDEVTRVRGEDFSKIQARFNMRLPLSSSDVSEVIQKRILNKKNVAKDTLMAYYDTKEAIIKNLIDFSQTQFKRKYSDNRNFADTYPFIPYQFDLLGNVLTEVRNHSSSGKHLAEGERSMLALIQESAISLKDKEIGTLVSFNKFYDCLEKWIDHSYRNVIDNAKRNEELEAFDVELLKVLFMIKHVKEISADIKNLTTLMIDHVDNDRISVTKSVESALNRLIKQTYVQKEGDYYSFLTNAEQDLNRAIKNERVENSEIVSEMKNIIFGELYNQTKFKYDTRYSYAFNQRIDDTTYNQNNPIGLMIVSPYNDNQYTDDDLRPLSFQQNLVILKLPAEIEFQTDIINYLQIKKYLTRNTGNADPVFQSLRFNKQEEVRKTQDRIRLFIEKGLKEADVFVNGNVVSIPNKSVKDRINEALSKLVGIIYNKHTYMETAPEHDEFIAIFNTPSTIHLDGIENNDNQLALDEVFNFVKGRNESAQSVSYKNILDRFTVQPYGFINNDVHWLILKLFKDKKVDLKLNGSLIQESNMTPTNIIKQVTDSHNFDRLIIQLKPTISTKQIKTVNELCKELDSSFTKIEDSDALMKVCKDLIQDYLSKLDNYLREYIANPLLPGKQLLDDYATILKKIKNKNEPREFYQYVNDKYEDILDVIEDVEPVINFHKGVQKNIYLEALSCKKKADNSNTYLTDDVLINNLSSISAILSNISPYRDIMRLPSLIDNFNNRFKVVLEDIIETQLQVLKAIDTEIYDEIGDNENIRNQFNSIITTNYNSFRMRILRSVTLADPYNIISEANNKKILTIQKIHEAILDEVIPDDSGHGDDEPVRFVVKTMLVQDLFDRSDKTITTEADLDNQLRILRNKLKFELDSGKVIKIKVK